MSGGDASADYEAEIARLHDFVLQVSQRLFLAAEVLSILAERKKSRVKPGSREVVVAYDAEVIEWCTGHSCTEPHP